MYVRAARASDLLGYTGSSSLRVRLGWNRASAYRIGQVAMAALLSRELTVKMSVSSKVSKILTNVRKVINI